MSKISKKEKEVVVYQSPDGAIELRGDIEQETLWITQKQMGQIFNVDVRTVNEHLKNIFKNKELNENSFIRKFRITANDGKTYQVDHYDRKMCVEF